MQVIRVKEYIFNPGQFLYGCAQVRGEGWALKFVLQCGDGPKEFAFSTPTREEALVMLEKLERDLRASSTDLREVERQLNDLTRVV